MTMTPSAEKEEATSMTDMQAEKVMERLESTLEQMANECSVGSAVWDRHCNAVLTAASLLTKLQAERDEAAKIELKLHRRVQELEERNADLEKESAGCKSWLWRAKDERGYSQNTSFDVVWAETCAKADLAEALRARISELENALERVTDHLETWARDHSLECTADIDAAIYCARATLKGGEK